MDVMGSLCVSVDSSTVQLHDNLGNRRVCTCSETGFSSQNGDHSWGVFYRSATFCCAFLWIKRLKVKNIHKEMFLVCGGKCLSREAVHNLIEKFSQGRSKVANDAWPGAEVVETTVRILLCCGFWRTGKAMGQVWQCWWRICREINVFSQVRISRVLRIISICGLFTDSPSYILMSKGYVKFFWCRIK
jgi:hypothetical protein